jgi:hypothetical protein
MSVCMSMPVCTHWIGSSNYDVTNLADLVRKIIIGSTLYHAKHCNQGELLVAAYGCNNMTHAP